MLICPLFFKSISKESYPSDDAAVCKQEKPSMSYAFPFIP